MSLFIPYAVILSLLYLTLSFRVIRLRFKYRSIIGAQESKRLEYAVRGHANFAEYVPFALLMTGLCHTLQAPLWIMHMVLGTLTVGRLCHAYCFFAHHHFIIRRTGMILTFLSLIISTLYLCATLLLMPS